MGVTVGLPGEQQLLPDRMSPHHQLLILATTLALLCLHHSEAACKFKGKQICEGAVTKEFKKSVRICTEGKVLKKKREEVEPGYPLAGGECVWYGEVLCDGAVVQDLYRWWFLLKCSANKMSVVSRSWSDVTSDRRFKVSPTD